MDPMLAGRIAFLFVSFLGPAILMGAGLTFLMHGRRRPALYLFCTAAFFVNSIVMLTWQTGLER